MQKQEMLVVLKNLYERALNANQLNLCLEILEEIIYVNKLRE